MWKTPFLRQVRKGLQNAIPSDPDGRRPLLLPLIMTRPHFLTVASDDQRLLRFATILGFIGMLRPHSIQDLQPQSFTVVTCSGAEIPMPKLPGRFYAEIRKWWNRNDMLGFYISFRSKTMSRAKAYFPNLSDTTAYSGLPLICPVVALVDIARRGLLKKGFLKDLNKEKRLTTYLQHITGLDQYIPPYALRIGGRTWLLARGMDRQFVDFLGTWKAPEASARYFRAAPHATIHMLRQFYLKEASRLVKGL